MQRASPLNTVGQCPLKPQDPASIFKIIWMRKKLSGFGALGNGNIARTIRKIVQVSQGIRQGRPSASKSPSNSNL
jgi:hypothetical protein